MNIPAELMNPCVAPAPLHEPATLGDFITSSIHLQEDYRECRIKQKALIRVVQIIQK